MLFRWFALLLMIFSLFAHAETIPATAGQTEYSYNFGCCIAWSASKEAALTRPDVLAYYSQGRTFDHYLIFGTTGQYARIYWTNGSTSGDFTVTTRLGGVSCPLGQNWTLSGSNCTRPDCVSPQIRNASTGVCEAPPCTAKTAASGTNQYFDMGTSASGAFPGVVCASGCLAVFSGSAPASSAVVSGVKRYFAKGTYTFAGGGSVDQCTAGVAAPAMGSGVAATPVSACASNQIEGLINGKLQCWNVPGSGVPPVAAPTTAPVITSGPTTTTNTSTVNNTTTTTEIISNPGGGQTTTTTACTDGNCVKTVSETKTGDEVEKEAEEGTPQAGLLAEVTELAEDDTRTIASVWAVRRAELGASPLFALASSLTSFPGVSASCPSWSVTGNIFGSSIGGSISPPCWIWAVLRAFLLLTSLFVARRMIFGG